MIKKKILSGHSSLYDSAIEQALWISAEFSINFYSRKLGPIETKLWFKFNQFQYAIQLYLENYND